LLIGPDVNPGAAWALPARPEPVTRGDNMTDYQAGSRRGTFDTTMVNLPREL